MPRPRKPANPAEALVGVAPLAARWIERLLASGEPPLTLAQYLALRAIASEPLAAAELARRAGVSGAAVSQLVSALEGAGWVEREPEPADRRRHQLKLTAAGFEAFQSATRRVYGGLGDVLAGLPPHEAKALTDLLVTLEHVLAGSPPPRRGPPPPRPK
jgi:DNA-binding MarR family transcriptional regulator